MKIYKILLILLSVVGALLWLMLPGSEVSAEEAATNSNVNLIFVVSYILLGCAVILTVLFSIKGMFAQHKLKGVLISLGVFALILLVSYGISSGEEVRGLDGSVIAEASTSKLVGGGLIAFYILTFVAIATMLFSSIKKILIK